MERKVGISAGNPYSIGTAEGVAGTEKARDRAEFERIDALREVMTTEAGRRVIWDLLDASHIFRTPMASSPNDTYYMIGRQHFGHELYATLNENMLDLFRLMQDEALDRAELERSKREEERSRTRERR